MNKYLLILILFLFVSCKKDEHVKNDDLTLLMNSYSLDKDMYKFGCFDANNRFIEIDSNTYYKYNEISFAGYMREINGVRIKEGKLFEDLREYLKSLNAYGYTVDYVKERILSITIYSDVPFRGVSQGRSLNDFFSIEGDFIRKENGKYKLYNGDNILRVKKIDEDIFFPRNFRIRLTEPPIESRLYNFYMRLELENKDMGAIVANIRLKI